MDSALRSRRTLSSQSQKPKRDKATDSQALLLVGGDDLATHLDDAWFLKLANTSTLDPRRAHLCERPRALSEGPPRQLFSWICVSPKIPTKFETSHVPARRLPFSSARQARVENSREIPLRSPLSLRRLAVSGRDAARVERLARAPRARILSVEQQRAEAVHRTQVRCRERGRRVLALGRPPTRLLLGPVPIRQQPPVLTTNDHPPFRKPQKAGKEGHSSESQPFPTTKRRTVSETESGRRVRTRTKPTIRSAKAQ